jgi:hypothetical protein
MPYKVLGTVMTKGSPVIMSKEKNVSVIVLTVFAVTILASGAAFAIYSLLTDLTFSVFGTQMPGLVFGLIIAYLGLRYCQSVRSLRQELAKSKESFSWKNFRKN